MAGKKEEGSQKPVTMEINKLRFTYPGIDGRPPPGSAPLIDDFSLTLHSGDRCLLVGSNGAGTSFLHFLLFIFVVTSQSAVCRIEDMCQFLLFLLLILVLVDYYYFFFIDFGLLGKTTILKILGGKHLVEPGMVRVLGRSAFHDTSLTVSGELCYLGGEVCFLFFFFKYYGNNAVKLFLLVRPSGLLYIFGCSGEEKLHLLDLRLLFKLMCLLRK